MKLFNAIMMFIRVVAIAIIVFCLYAFMTDKTDLLKEMAEYFVPFILVYFVGSIFQMYLRFSAAGRYKDTPRAEDKEE